MSSPPSPTLPHPDDDEELPQPQPLPATPLPPALKLDGGEVDLASAVATAGAVALASVDDGGANSDSESVQLQKSILRRKSEGFVAFNKGFEDCDVTAEATNPVKKDTTTKAGKVNLSPMTPLKAIAEASIQVLKIDDLRMFCSHNGIRGSRKAKKADICWAICKAKAQQMAGHLGPYKDLIPVSDLADDEDNHLDVADSLAASEVWGDVDSSERANKRRRVEDATGLGNHLLTPSIPTMMLKARHTNGKSDLITLQKRLVRSKEHVNLAIQLREMIESAATLRREIREEKDRRASQRKQLVDNAGDDSLATTRVKAVKEDEDKQDANEEDEVKGSHETLAENVNEQDELLKQMVQQYAGLNRMIDRLIPKDISEDASTQAMAGTSEEAAIV